MNDDKSKVIHFKTKEEITEEEVIDLDEYRMKKAFDKSKEDMKKAAEKLDW